MAEDSDDFLWIFCLQDGLTFFRSIQNVTDGTKESDMGATYSGRGKDHDEDLARKAVETVEFDANLMNTDGGNYLCNSAGFTMGQGYTVFHTGTHAVFALHDGVICTLTITETVDVMNQFEHFPDDAFFVMRLQFKADGFWP